MTTLPSSPPTLPVSPNPPSDTLHSIQAAPAANPLREEPSQSTSDTTNKRLPKRRRGRGFDSNVEVEMTPLIDCVFLLLIFFLVTTMMKKLEKQIPVMMPDTSVAVAPKADRDHVVLGIAQDGRLLFGSSQNALGGYVFSPLQDVDAYIAYIKSRHGAETNIRIYASPEVHFQKVIDLLDKLKFADFEHVDVRMIDTSIFKMADAQQPR